MRVIPTNFTVADYCREMASGDIFPNKNYQRSDQVWPVAARSYLIDTILQGYPIPKLSLAQITDLKSRRTRKEIVDGQQRSQAILDFYEGNLKLTSRSVYSGKNYESLDEEEQRKFLDYQLSVDLFVGATAADIREVFRRINSYTVPLNPQEQRHAIYQGEFKWFIVKATSSYTQSLVDIGVFSESQVSRMADAQFFAEVSMTVLDGIFTYSKTKINDFYGDNDRVFVHEGLMTKSLESGISDILLMKAIHHTSLMKPSNFFALLVAVMHCRQHFKPLDDIYDFGAKRKPNHRLAEANLAFLADALISDSPPKKLMQFIKASREGTNTLKNRTERILWCCKAINEEWI